MLSHMMMDDGVWSFVFSYLGSLLPDLRQIPIAVQTISEVNFA